MYFVLYDKNLKSIGETYILESWSRTLRAIDFDEIKIVGEQIPYSASPFLVVVNDRQGRQMFSGLASTPSIDDKAKKTSLTLKDYLTLFNTEIIIDWDTFTGTTVAQYIEFLLTTWLEQTDVGLANINWDCTNIKDKDLDTDIYNFSGKENVLLYDLISDAINYYNLYTESFLDVAKKQLTFSFKKANIATLSVRLSDFGINSIEKSFGDYNRVNIYTHEFIKNQEWALTEDNNVVKLPNTQSPLIYPAKYRNFIAEEPNEKLTENDAINNAVYDAVMGLVQNRYQENIDLNARQYKSIIDLTNINFSYIIKVYTNEGEYKDLPVGEIETDSNGKHIIRLGYRIQELTQEL